MQIKITPITTETSKADWEALYRGYADFYHTAMPQNKLDLVWSWLIDPNHQTSGLAAYADDVMVGLAHHRLFARPLAGATGL